MVVAIPLVIEAFSDTEKDQDKLPSEAELAPIPPADVGAARTPDPEPSEDTDLTLPCLVECDPDWELPRVPCWAEEVWAH